MAKQNYTRYLVQEHGDFPLELAGRTPGKGKDIIPGVKAENVLRVDETKQEGFHG